MAAVRGALMALLLTGASIPINARLFHAPNSHHAVRDVFLGHSVHLMT